MAVETASEMVTSFEVASIEVISFEIASVNLSNVGECTAYPRGKRSPTVT